MVNLLCAHIKRFHFNRRKIGLLFVHAGLILLMGGFFLSEVLQIESQMRLEIGESKSYAEDSRRNELVVIDTTNPDHDSVTAIPEADLQKGGEIHPAGLPFALRVKRYLPNSSPGRPDVRTGDEKFKAGNGIGQTSAFHRRAGHGADGRREQAGGADRGRTRARDRLGDWTVSTWLTKRPWFRPCRNKSAALLGVPIMGRRDSPWPGRTYQIALRPVRYYKPYTITPAGI